MKIRVNGKEETIELENEKALLSSTLEFLGYKQNTIVVELNDLIINSKKWENAIIKEGDRLEIVSIVGGG
ncbi:sulfur carrier protein ThiS [Prochlorococcus sp. AH-716-E13]|nr:sulfur carrier protein ThiS [Prochlorococcus sp. AH-716-E13]